MSNLDELMSNINWMIHDLVDGDQIDNDEEKRLTDVYKQACAELKSLRAVVEAAKYVVGETHGVNDDSVPDTFKMHLTVGDIRYLSAALERVTK